MKARIASKRQPARACSRAVNHLSQEVRETVQEMIDGRLARRRSVWFG